MLILDSQHGFRKGRSCLTNRLGRKLESHGITGTLLTWILEWLAGRKQRVCINGVTSKWQFVVLSGVLY